MRSKSTPKFDLKPVSIVIPVLNHIELTKNFLQSMSDKTSAHYEMIIIDNNSTDGTKEFLNEISKNDPRVKIITNEKNIGVSASWNQGIKESQYEYVCFVNNDVEVLIPFWLREMQKTLNLNKNIYWTSPRTCYDKDMSNISYHASHYEQLFYGPNRLGYIVGCCFMCPSHIFNNDEIGLFDEKFDIKYYEDLDYINRILQNGKRVSMTPSSLVYHGVGRTSLITPGGGGNLSYYNEKWGNTQYNILAMQTNREKGIKHFKSKKG